ncbi:hypothetical protein MOQ72_43545 [Saccharopolyspora sp. K220]|uniref:hypothetical protein n=1 Tax=Saccharopolyspora soli TaxID=2926618 RepID=UPI001F569B72|nr:hypothetical protein [Saccharopolyspora soli]MCI2424289.1 hypothetical protein [Saccharopolyspora soli]
MTGQSATPATSVGTSASGPGAEAHDGVEQAGRVIDDGDEDLVKVWEGGGDPFFGGAGEGVHCCDV